MSAIIVRNHEKIIFHLFQLIHVKNNKYAKTARESYAGDTVCHEA